MFVKLFTFFAFFVKLDDAGFEGNLVLDGIELVELFVKFLVISFNEGLLFVDKFAIELDDAIAALI